MLLQKLKFNKQSGSIMLEVVLGMAVFAVLASAIILLFADAYNNIRLGMEEAQASFYAQEGLEAAQSIWRVDGYEVVGLYSVGTGLDSSSGRWLFTHSEDSEPVSGSTSDTLGKYTRSITVEQVNRTNTTGSDITTSGGVLDIYSKKVEATVSWDFNLGDTRSVILTEYLTQYEFP